VLGAIPPSLLTTLARDIVLLNLLTTLVRYIVLLTW
jgi:hypothetical protein